MRRRSTVIALTFASVQLVVACSVMGSSDDEQPEESTPSTLVDPAFATAPVIVGDSLTVNARSTFATWFPGAVVDAEPGRTMVTPDFSDAAIDRVSGLPGEPGRPWVIALGTNDAGYNELPPGRLKDELDLLLAALGLERCVWWLLPHVEPPMPTSMISQVDDFAEQVRRTIAERPCGGVLEWRDVVQSTPGLLAPDGVHLTEEGAAAFVALVATLIPVWSGETS